MLGGVPARALPEELNSAIDAIPLQYRSPTTTLANKAAAARGALGRESRRVRDGRVGRQEATHSPRRLFIIG